MIDNKDSAIRFCEAVGMKLTEANLVGDNLMYFLVGMVVCWLLMKVMK